MSFTEHSVRRPVTTIMVFVSLVVVGLIATKLVPLEYFPDISFPGAYINVPYPGASPNEVEEQVIKPMEEALATISGVDRINSNSGENNGGIRVIFNQGSDIHLKAIEIKEKLKVFRINCQMILNTTTSISLKMEVQIHYNLEFRLKEIYRTLMTC